MNTKLFRSFLTMGALAATCAAWGCVADRPARNGVYNENQYVRKDFLVRPATAGAKDPGWFLKSTVISTSTPNPLAAIGLMDGDDNSYGGEQYVRFDITEDKLQMLGMAELEAGNPAQGATNSEVVNAWPVTNVDLKYRVNLDGETSNFYEENTELDWQVRQWVKLNLDKNDLSDVAPIPNLQTMLGYCTDLGNASSTLVPNSFVVDEANDYMTWQIQVTVPVLFTNSSCVTAYGSTGTLFQEMGRTDVTFTLMYSMVRAATDSGFARADGSPSTYVAMPLGEKDLIQRKYGIWTNAMFGEPTWNRDMTTGLLAAQANILRHNPNEPIVYYFAPGYPADKTGIFTNPGGIADQTNTILETAGAKGRLSFMWYDDLKTFGDHANPAPRQYGDVRYGFIRWVSNLEQFAAGGGVLAATADYFDRRTGEVMNATVNYFDWPVYDYVTTRLDYYLQTIGAEDQLDAKGNWPTVPKGYSATCKVGETVPFGGLDFSTGGVVQTQHNATSTVYDKMQLYLHKPSTTYGYMSPYDFVPKQSQDFYDAFYKVMPYQVFMDPAMNPYVIPEGGSGYYSASREFDGWGTTAKFEALTQQIDMGNSPYVANPAIGYTPSSAAVYTGTGSADDIAASQAFAQNLQSLWMGMLNQQYLSSTVRPGARGHDVDPTGILTGFQAYARTGRRCVSNDPVKDPIGKKGATHWQTRQEWVQAVADTYTATTMWHEFGHSLGLEHNFMGSVDRVNFPTWTDVDGTTRYGMFTSSVMEYNVTPDSIFWTGGATVAENQATTSASGDWTGKGKYNGMPGWGPYDQAALGWTYGNSLSKDKVGPDGSAANIDVPSGQTSATSPWNDPFGYIGKKEVSFLHCGDGHVKYTPFCRQFDFGTTPSEIVAWDIDNYEFNYKWRNYRLYNKFWNDGPYANSVANTFYDMRRFLSAWAYDWSVGELSESFPRVGVVAPSNVPMGQYFTSLGMSFSNDISVANQLIAAFHKAIIQQSSGERPYVTLYDQFYGDVVQQGIILDKLFADENWNALFEVDNYDPTQSAGAYMFAATGFDLNYQTVSEDTLMSMLGGEYGLAFNYVSPMIIQMFAEASHDINFTARTEMRDWVGGLLFGGPEIDCNQPFLDYFHALAQQSDAIQVDPVIFAGCVQGEPLDNCAWDPRIPNQTDSDQYHSDDYNEFRGPDGRRYAWAMIHDRDQIVVVDRDRNTASYIAVRGYNTDIVATHDDGSSGAYAYELPLKYTLGYFTQYN